MTNNVLRDVKIRDRAPLMIKNYTRYAPDALGLQECDLLAYQTVVEPMLSDQYAVTGTTVATDGALSRTPILYRNDLYALIEQGSDYFTHRYTNSKTYSYAVFEQRKDGARFAVINVHFAIVIGSYPKEIGTDEETGNQWRCENAKQVIGIAERLSKNYANIPIFLLGDFNCDSRQAPYQILTSYFNDTLCVASLDRSRPKATYHPVGKMPCENGLPCDFIFVTQNSVNVLSCKIIDDRDMIESTDHLALIVEASIS